MVCARVGRYDQRPIAHCRTLVPSQCTCRYETSRFIGNPGRSARCSASCRSLQADAAELAAGDRGGDCRNRFRGLLRCKMRSAARPGRGRRIFLFRASGGVFGKFASRKLAHDCLGNGVANCAGAVGVGQRSNVSHYRDSLFRWRLCWRSFSFISCRLCVANSAHARFDWRGDYAGNCLLDFLHKRRA